MTYPFPLVHSQEKTDITPGIPQPHTSSIYPLKTGPGSLQANGWPWNIPGSLHLEQALVESLASLPHCEMFRNSSRIIQKKQQTSNFGGFFLGFRFGIDSLGRNWAPKWPILKLIQEAKMSTSGWSFMDEGRGDLPLGGSFGLADA